MPTDTAEHTSPDSGEDTGAQDARAQHRQDLQDDLRGLIDRGVNVRSDDAGEVASTVINTRATEKVAETTESAAPTPPPSTDRREQLRERLRSMRDRARPNGTTSEPDTSEAARDRWKRVFTQQETTETAPPTPPQAPGAEAVPATPRPSHEETPRQTIYARPRATPGTGVETARQTPATSPDRRSDVIDVEGEEVDLTATPETTEQNPIVTDKEPATRLSEEALNELIKQGLTGDVIDVSRSTRAAAEHKAGQVLRESKLEMEAERKAFMDAHPKLADNAAGRILLNVISTAKHPVETVWRQNIFREYYRQKEVHKFLGGEKSDRIALGEDAKNATFARFEAADAARASGDTTTESVYRHANETLNEHDSPEVTAFKGELTSLFKEYSTGEMSLEDFEEAKGRLIAEQTGIVKTRQVDGERVADTIDNLTKIAVDLRTIFEHTLSTDLIDQKLANLQLVTGEALVGPRAEVRKTSIDRIIEKTSSSKMGSLVNEQTIALAVAGAYALGTKGATSVAARALGTIGLGSVASGTVAYFRERGSNRQEFTEVEREIATGYQVEGSDLDSSPVRARLTESLAGMTSAQDMVDGLQAKYDALPEADAEGRVDVPPAQAAELLDMIAQARARTMLGDTLGRDLIRYSSGETMESERLALDTHLINMTNFLREHYDVDHPDHRPEAFASFDELLDSKVKLIIEGDTDSSTAGLRAEIAAGDKSFESFSKNRAIKRALTTSAIGALTGLAVKEGIQFGSKELGLGHNVNVKVPRPMENQKMEGFGTAYEYPKDWKLSYETGTITSVKSGNVIADHLTFKEHGGFSDASVEALRAKGYNIELQHAMVDGPPVEAKVNVDAFADAQGKVQRFWQDNNTSRFDKNELRTYIRKDGNDIVVDARSMSPNGSYHGGRFVDAQSQFADGQGKLLFSLDKNHQSTPLQMEIGRDGMVRIPADSDAARNLFKIEGDRVTSQSAFMEVATNRGTGSTGAQQFDVLSTVKGDGITELTSTSNPEPVTLTRTIMTVMGEKTETTTSGIEMPWLFVPWSSRFGLENLPASQPSDGDGRRNGEEEGSTNTPESSNPDQPTGVERPETGTGVGTAVVVFDGPPADDDTETPRGIGRGLDNDVVISGTPRELEPGAPTATGVATGATPQGPNNNPTPETDPEEVEVSQQPGRPDRVEAAERAARVRHSGDVARVTEQLLKEVGLDTDEVIDGGLEKLQLKLRSYEYSTGDIATTRALLDRAEAMLTDDPTKDRKVSRDNLARVRSYLDTMESEYDPARLSRLSLIYAAKDTYQKIHAVRHALPVDMGARDAVQQRFNRSLDRVRSGRELSPRTYQRMSGLLASSSELSTWILSTKRDEALAIETDAKKKREIKAQYNNRIKRSEAKIEAQTIALGIVGIQLAQAKSAGNQAAEAEPAEEETQVESTAPTSVTDDTAVAAPPAQPELEQVTEPADETPVEPEVDTAVDETPAIEPVIPTSPLDTQT